MSSINLKPHFPSLLVWKENGSLQFKNFQRLSISIGNTGLNPVLSNRAESTINLIKQSDEIYSFRDFEPILVSIGDSDDHYKWGAENSIRILNYCTRWDNFSDTCPDFVFDRWAEAGYENYEEFCKKIIVAGESKPQNDLAVWRGLVDANRKVRKKLVSIGASKLIDVMDVVSGTGNPSDCALSKDYISIDEQVGRYRYIINANGQGHSRRFKLEMFSGRVIFLIERRYEEWFYPQLKPWVHYVPVKQDLSDLVDNIEIIKSSPDIEELICYESKKFALENLKKEDALYRFNQLLNIQESRPNQMGILPTGRFNEMDCRDDDYREDA